jgi:replication factor C small subunit
MLRESEVWTEKYRPMTLDNLIEMEDKKSQLKGFIEKKNLPHLMFVGPPGSGRTSTVLSLLHDLFLDQFNFNVEEINATDSKEYLMKYKPKWFNIAQQDYNRQESGTPGLNFIIKSIFRNFPMMRTFSEIPFRVLIIKDADNLTMDIQQALRRTLEKSSRTCRFILICENLSKIIAPIKSRFVVMRFNPLEAPYVSAILRYIISKERIDIQEDALSAIIFLGRGNMIRTINMLQAVAAVFEGKSISSDAVYQVIHQFVDFKVKQVIDFALNKRFLEARERLREIFLQFGLTGQQIYDRIRAILFKHPIPEAWKVAIFDLMGEYELRMKKGSNDEIHLSAFLSQLGVLKLN